MSKKEETTHEQENEIKTPWQIEHEKYLKEQEEKSEISPKEEQEEEELTLSRSERRKKKKEEKAAKKEEIKYSETIEDTEENSKTGVEEHETFAKTLPKMKKQRNRKLIRRLTIITVIFVVAILISLYQISPLSRLGSIEVTGEKGVSAQTIIASSGLEQEGPLWEQFFSKDVFEKKIVDSNPRVHSALIELSGIHSFSITIIEYKVAAYEHSGEYYHPILENGVVLKEENISQEERTENLPTLVGFHDDEKRVHNFVVQYQKLAQDLQVKIQTVELTPTSSNPDLVTFTMRDGNLVRVSIEDINEKMVFYNSVVSQLDEPSVIDMEAGIFAYPMTMKGQEEEQTDDTTDETTDENG